MNDLTTTTISTPPSTPSREMIDLIAAYHSRVQTTPMGRSSISSKMVPAGADRTALQERRNGLMAAMKQGPREEIARLISSMFLGFAPRKMTESEAAQTLALYVSQLQRFPAWAVKRACELALRPDKKTECAPSVATLHALCQDVTAWCWTEAREIADILDAEVYVEPSPEMRERVGQGMRSLAEELRASNLDLLRKDARKPMCDVTPAEAQSRLDELRANPEPPPALSPLLRSMLRSKLLGPETTDEDLQEALR